MTAVIIPAEQATTCPATATGVCLVLRMAASMAMADARQTSVHRFHFAVSLLAVHISCPVSTRRPCDVSTTRSANRMCKTTTNTC